MNRLTGTVSVVTGAGSGLGRAIVDTFVAEGGRVVALDRSADKLAALTDATSREDVVVHQGDVRSYADNEAACRLAVDSFGRLDTFVANAGLWDFGSSLADTDPDRLEAAFDEIFAVNVKSQVLGAKAALPHLVASRGSVILTLSNAAFYPMGGGPVYVASKHAGVGLVRQLAFELAPDVRVNAVAPGGMDTDLRGPSALGLDGVAIGQAFPINEVMEQQSALHLVATAADYVAPYVMLASASESRVVTGTVLDVSSFGIQAKPPAPEAAP